MRTLGERSLPGDQPSHFSPHHLPRRGAPRGSWGRLQHALAINPPGNKLESMVENDDTPTVTIEVEMAELFRGTRRLV